MGRANGPVAAHRAQRVTNLGSSIDGRNCTGQVTRGNLHSCIGSLGLRHETSLRTGHRYRHPLATLRRCQLVGDTGCARNGHTIGEPLTRELRINGPIATHRAQRITNLGRAIDRRNRAEQNAFGHLGSGRGGLGHGGIAALGAPHRGRNALTKMLELRCEP